MEHSSKELPFLDILIKNKNDEITTDIYHKPRDTQQYFHFNSHHPKNCIKSIPYTLAYRIYTIITDKDLRKTHLKELHATWHQRGYPNNNKINREFKLAEKNTPKRIKEPEKSTTMRNP